VHAAPVVVNSNSPPMLTRSSMNCRAADESASPARATTCHGLRNGVASARIVASDRVLIAPTTASAGSSATPSPASAERWIAAFEPIARVGGAMPSLAITSSVADLLLDPSSRTSQVASPSLPAHTLPGLETSTNSLFRVASDSNAPLAGGRVVTAMSI
jgi:hypothetical protein